MAWTSSDRRSRLPADWPVRRKRILIRDRFECQGHTDLGLCGMPANQVDHIEPSGSDDEWNLQSLCEDCHARKSSAEGLAARKRLEALTKRPPEQTPGRRSPAEAIPLPRRGF